MLRSLVIALLTLASLSSTASWASTNVASFDGQVVCSQCWFEADRSRTPYGVPADLACAKRCGEVDVPVALAVRDEDNGSFELLLLDDPPASHPEWLELVGRFVRVSGSVDRKKGKKKLEVATLEVLDETPWPAPSSDGGPPADPASFSWTDLSGHTMSLDDLRGRVVVLNFWATWCAPCRREMPDLVDVQNRYGLFGLQVIGASADSLDQADEVLQFARSKKLNFPIVLGADTNQMQALGLGVTLPATIVFDREGRVVKRFAGIFERKALEAAVEHALAASDHHGEHGAHGFHPAQGAGDEHVHVATAGLAEASLVPS